MHVFTFPLLIILTGIIIDWIRFRPERVAAVTPATSRWRPRALSACADALNAKEQSFSMSPIHLTPSQNRDAACGKSLIRMMENKNHVNPKSNNDNKDKVPRKRHFGNRACVCAVASANSLCDPMDFSPPGSSAHGLLQARTLEWVAILSSRRSSRPRNQTNVS